MMDTIARGRVELLSGQVLAEPGASGGRRVEAGTAGRKKKKTPKILSQLPAVAAETRPGIRWDGGALDGPAAGTDQRAG